MINNKLVYLILGVAVFLGAVSSIYFFIGKKSIYRQLTQSKKVIQELRENIAALEQEKEKMNKEKEKLQKDSLIYVELNTKAQEEKEKIQQGLIDAQKIIETKEAELERLKLSLERAQRQSSKEIGKEKEKLEKQRKDLSGRIFSLSAALKKERALFNYNLGVAYTQAKLYDDALEAYEKALKIEPDMAWAHYNLGLLYESIEQDYEKAIEHYAKFLGLTEDSSEREEAEEAITRLSKEPNNVQTGHFLE